MFWRHKPRDDGASSEAGEGTREDGLPADPAPDWEPDPADFDDPPAADPVANVVPQPRVEQVAEPPAKDGVGPSAVGLVEPAAAGLVESDAEGAATLEPSATPGSLDAGLARSRGGFVARLRGLLSGGPAEGPSWDEVEETLIGGDVGAGLAIEIVERARTRRDPAGNLAAVRTELAALLVSRDPAWRPRAAAAGQPAVVLIVGVNGTGKTTTIGKLASRYRAEGASVILAAADTFRAAAIEQLEIWAARSGSTMIAHAPGADPGAVVYDALDAAVARGVDLVIADTAGRLHTKVNLMDELAKVRRIIDKRLPGARPEVLFVLDATTGQNGLAQARAFNEATGLTGIVLTKLDSTAKGGIVFAIEAALGVPVRFVGVGEQVGDLLPFDPDAFVAALFAG